ncbi:MAG: histidinol-phosphatase [Pseudomonadota bacterium]
MTDLPSDEVWAVADALADVAGKAILPHFRATSLAAENKLDEGFDPVTIADRAAEEAMRAVLADMRPNDGILGEEFAPVAGTSGLTWVLDPIDGTRSFISGTPTWGVLIALVGEDGPILGVVDQPYIRERFCGGLGRASVTGPMGTHPLVTRPTTKLVDATIFTTFPEVGTDAERAAFNAVAGQTRLTRYGCDCYAYALVAAGQIDLVMEAGLNAYDICGPIGVIEAAGGIVTNWEGGPVHEGGRALAACTPELHRAALEIIHST